MDDEIEKEKGGPVSENDVNKYLQHRFRLT